MISLDTVNRSRIHFLLMLNIPYCKTLIKSKARLEMKAISLFLQNNDYLLHLKKTLILTKGLCKLWSKEQFKKCTLGLVFALYVCFECLCIDLGSYISRHAL